VTPEASEPWPGAGGPPPVLVRRMLTRTRWAAAATATTADTSASHGKPAGSAGTGYPVSASEVRTAGLSQRPSGPWQEPGGEVTVRTTPMRKTT
jgi:hypothetical protein